MIYNIAPEETDFFGNLYSQCVHMFQFSGGFMIGTKEGLNKEDLGLKLKIKGEFTLSYSINEGLRQLREAVAPAAPR